MKKELQQKIQQLKQEKDIAILAHSYQSVDILEIADQTGDSFKLSVVAKDMPQSTVVLCGVRFMAETVKNQFPVTKEILPKAEEI